EKPNEVGFAGEHRHVLGVCLQAGQQPLQRKFLALMGAVESARLEHLGHSAAAEQAQQLVVTHSAEAQGHLGRRCLSLADFASASARRNSGSSRSALKSASLVALSSSSLTSPTLNASLSEFTASRFLPLRLCAQARL